MKLISMIDFVLEQEKYWNYETTGLENSIRKYKDCVLQINNYAKFLKQPLKLEMFVPCDENGNLLEEIMFSEQVHIYLNYQEKQDYVKRCDVYKKAKEKVLFEGFYVKNDDDGKLCLFHQDCEWDIATIEPNFVWGRTNEFIIEDIVIHNPKLSLFVLNENSISRLLQACC